MNMIRASSPSDEEDRPEAKPCIRVYIEMKNPEEELRMMQIIVRADRDVVRLADPQNAHFCIVGSLAIMQRVLDCEAMILAVLYEAEMKQEPPENVCYVTVKEFPTEIGKWISDYRTQVLLPVKPLATIAGGVS